MSRRAGPRALRATADSCASSFSSVATSDFLAEDAASLAVQMTPLHDPTHRVTNQVAPLAGYNLYASDAALREAVGIHGGEWASSHLRDHGEKRAHTDDHRLRMPPRHHTHVAAVAGEEAGHLPQPAAARQP